TAAVGALVSFQEGSDLLQELAGVEVEAKQVERTAEALGAEVIEDERRWVEPDPPEPLPSTLYLGIDGTGVPMRRSELRGRTGKQADGSAKTREVKLCTVWSAESRDAEGHPVRDEGSVTYSAAIESAASADADPHASEFAQRVGRAAQRRRFEQATHRVHLGDGAPWSWNLGQDPAQACRHALESARRQCHHCPALLSPECSLRRLLGTPRAEEGRVTLTTLMSCARSHPASCFGPRPVGRLHPQNFSRLPGRVG